jgi:hypothetical protein
VSATAVLKERQETLNVKSRGSALLFGCWLWFHWALPFPTVGWRIGLTPGKQQPTLAISPLYPYHLLQLLALWHHPQ